MYFFEVQIKYQRQTGEENKGNVTENYLVESLNPSNAEARVIEEISPYISGDHEVPHITKRNLYDIINNPDGDLWYKGRVEVITIDDNGGESRKAVTILVAANTIDKALQQLQAYTRNLDCEIISIVRTKILEIYRATK